MSTKAEMPHPHQGTPVLSLGSDLKNAKRALILLHGRGASAEDMAGLAQEFSLPGDLLVLAPQASENVWYPQRLTAPIETNEPFLSSALLRVTEVVGMLHENGIPAEKVLIGGFSQGASLAIEFVLRNARRWGGLLAFSGGYIWPIGQPRPFRFPPRTPPWTRARRPSTACGLKLSCPKWMRRSTVFKCTPLTCWCLPTAWFCSRSG